VTAALSAIQASGAADKTRARLHGTLTGLFGYLIEQGLLEQDPLVSAGVERPKVGRRLPRRQARTGTPARKKDPVFLNTRLALLSTAALDHSVRRWFARAGVPLPPGPRRTPSGTPSPCNSSAWANPPPSCRTSSGTPR